MTAVQPTTTPTGQAPGADTARPAPRRPRNRRSTAPAHPSRRLLVSLFYAALGLCLLALLGHAYVVGHGTDVGLGGMIDDGLLKATTSSGTAVFVAFAILIVAAWCFRRIRLERLAAGPGRIEVPDFSVMTDKSEVVDAVHLTALFRQRLATLRLQSPAPVPGSAPAGDFLEVLGGGAVDVKNPLATVLSVLRAAKPSHAWEVRGVLVRREIEPSYGVTVHVSRVPDLGAPPDAVYDYTWERAIRRAADRATAHILPHTRTCRSPWSSWRGLVMPPALIEAYENAVDMETRGRYDKALGAYYEALRHDPLNLPLRLQLGQLQEKLGLHLDALSTYQGLICVGRSSVDSAAERRRATAETWHVLLAAEYRRIVLLGGPALAHQWCRLDDSDNCKRNAQRASVRERLRLELEEPLRACRRPADRYDVAHLLDAPATAPDRERIERELRELFALYAVGLLGKARECLAVAKERWHGEDKLPVTAVGLDLTGVCIDVRLGWLGVQLGPHPRRWIWSEASVAAIEAEIGRHRARMCRWHEYYTAACAFALPLLVEEDHESGEDEADSRKLLAARAIGHLKQATACADSGYFASRRDWLLAEDPDLDGLRPQPHFKAFEATYLPSGDATPRRPRKLQRLQTTRYTDEMLVASTRRCAQLWRGRDGAMADPRAAWRTECRVWELTAGAAENYRHWRARLELLDAVDKLSLEHGHEVLDAAFRRYDEPSPDGSLRDPGDAARLAIARSQSRLRGLAALITPRTPLTAAIDAWVDALRTHAPTADHVAHAAPLHAQLWESLAEWMVAEDPRALSRARRRFAGEIERTSAYLNGGWAHD
jgi:hypothetical protein